MTTQGEPADGSRDIFFVSNSVDELGGITTWTHQMAGLFTERGHRVRLIGITPAHAKDPGAGPPCPATTLCRTHPPRPHRPRGLRGPLGLAGLRRRRQHAAGMREQAAKLTQMFRAARPGAVVIVTQVWAMEWVALADTAGATVIGMSHESHRMCRGSSRYGRVKRLYRDVDRMLVLTREDADLWIRQGLDNTGCMPNPLPFLPEVPSPRTARTVLSIGRLADEKGVDLLLDTWSQVAPRHPDWTLRIYGAGEEEEVLHKQCTSLGLDDSVEWMGPTSDAPSALRDASVFTLPSRGEGFPLTLMEAMSAAVPCVAFDCAPGVREIVRDQEDGLLAPPGHTGELAHCLDRLMTDHSLRDSLGDRARQNIRRYATDRITEQWEELFILLER